MINHIDKKNSIFMLSKKENRFIMKSSTKHEEEENGL